MDTHQEEMRGRTSIGQVQSVQSGRMKPKEESGHKFQIIQSGGTKQNEESGHKFQISISTADPPRLMLLDSNTPFSMICIYKSH